MGERGQPPARAGTNTAPPAQHVARPRLTRLLDQVGGQAIAIVAPAGYGKTALASEWLQDKENVCWFQASAASADLAAFATGVGVQLQHVIPGAGERLRRRVRIDDVPEQAARPAAELLAEDLAGWPQEAWLVVDDYHLVGNSAAVEEFVDWLLALSPVRLLVTTRRRPTWATARRILYGEVTEITREQLAMTSEEAGQVLAGHSDETVRRLIEQAQGWPALIGLAARSASFALPEARISEALFRYFAEEVFRNEPAEVQEFMLATAVPLRVDAHTARDVLGLNRADAAIERLAGEGLLQQAGVDSYRFHPLLRDFLLRKLEAEDPDRRSGLYSAAIADARGAGRVEEAFELAAEAGALDVAADVLAASAPDLFVAGRLETVERWLGVCGGTPLTRSDLILVKAEVLMRRGQLFEASALAGDLAERLPANDTNASLAWYVAARAFHLLSEDDQALECHLRAAEVARAPKDRANALWGAAVVAAQLENDVIDRLVDEMEELAEAAPEARLQLLSAKVYRGSRRATLAGVWKDVDRLVPVAEAAPDPMARGSFYIAGCYVNVARARYAHARELLERGLAGLEAMRFGPIKRAFCLCQLAAADIGLRRFAEAEQTLREMASLGVGNTPALVAEQRVLRMKLLLARGGAAEVAAAFDLADDGYGDAAHRGEFAGLLAVAAAAAGRPELSETAARRARELTRTIEARFHAAFAGPVARLASDPDSRGARAEAAEVVAQAAEAEFLDAFVIAYRAFPPLLQIAVDEPTTLAIARDVVAEAADHALAKRVGLALAQDGRPAPALSLLTPRETEVLELMAEGLPNAEIARRLFISEKTAKVHVYHIFEKLGVTTRVQAVLALKNMLPLGTTT